MLRALYLSTQIQSPSKFWLVFTGRIKNTIYIKEIKGRSDILLERGVT